MKSFKRKEQLTLHIVIHSGKKSESDINWNEDAIYQFILHLFLQVRKSMSAMNVAKDSIARII